jgi:hypothetical protein
VSVLAVLIASPCRLYYRLVRDYLPELQRARAARDASLQDIKDKSMNQFMKDLAIDRAKNPQAFNDTWDEEDEDVDDINLIDKSDLFGFYLTAILTPSCRR